MPRAARRTITAITPKLRDHVTGKLASAANFTIPLIPISISQDELYEALVGEHLILSAFRNATQYLPPSGYKGVRLVEFEGQQITLSLNLRPTEKYNTFLFPASLSVINSESKLYHALYAQIKFAYRWQMLCWAWERLSAIPYADIDVLGVAFPWLRTAFEGIDYTDWESRYQLKKLAKHEIPDKVFRLSPALARVCSSGSELLGQFNILQSTDSTGKTPYVIVHRTSLTPMPWLNKMLNETRADWTDRI